MSCEFLSCTLTNYYIKYDRVYNTVYNLETGTLVNSNSSEVITDYYLNEFSAILQNSLTFSADGGLYFYVAGTNGTYTLLEGKYRDGKPDGAVEIGALLGVMTSGAGKGVMKIPATKDNVVIEALDYIQKFTASDSKIIETILNINKNSESEQEVVREIFGASNTDIDLPAGMNKVTYLNQKGQYNSTIISDDSLNKLKGEVIPQKKTENND